MLDRCTKHLRKKRIQKKNSERGWKRGRGKRNPEHKRSSFVKFRVSHSEREILKYAVKLHNKPLSQLTLEPLLEETMNNIIAPEFWPPLKPGRE